MEHIYINNILRNAYNFQNTKHKYYSTVACFPVHDF